VSLLAAIITTCLARRWQRQTFEAAPPITGASLHHANSPPAAKVYRPRLSRADETYGQAKQHPDTEASEAENETLNGTEVFAAFASWLEDYGKAESDIAAQAMEAKGELLAVQRRAALAELIETDPKRAIELAIPVGTRQKLPPSVKEQLEERVSGLARLEVIASVAAPGTEPANSSIERFVTVNDRTFKAFVYGRRAAQTCKDNIPVHGIALSDKLAVHESPVRRLDADELADASLPAASGGGRCPVSGAEGTAAVAAQVGQEIFNLCGPGHIESLNQALEAEEAGIGPARRISKATSTAESWTQGLKRVLFLPLNFPDDPEPSISQRDAAELMRQVNDFFIENSYGTVSFAVTIAPVLTLPRPKSWYARQEEDATFLRTLIEEARAAATAAGFDCASFDLDCVHLKSEVFANSRGYVGAKGALLQYRDAGLACHEFGHNLGLWHANAWKTSDGSIIGAGKNVEYGNPFDAMGGGQKSQFNACYKHQLNWLPDRFVQTIESEGIYRLYPFDVPTLADGLTYALRVRKDDQRDYWIEARQALGTRGILVNWSPWGASAGGTQLLDMTPRSEGGYYDAPLALGRSFYDPATGLKIIPLCLGGTTPESIDVLVKQVHDLTAEAESGTVRGQLAARREFNGEVTVVLADESGLNWTIQTSSNFVTWEELAAFTNVTGAVQFTDASARYYDQRYYRAVSH
ncbi:MAG: hypothetical protein L0Z50_22225, partial [Verrucomicrobiales bacterium]|nr:hypothetical protein [Verrucomicrobiales bacterium]